MRCKAQGSEGQNTRQKKFKTPYAETQAQLTQTDLPQTETNDICLITAAPRTQAVPTAAVATAAAAATAVDANAADWAGNTPLLAAASLGRVPALRVLHRHPGVVRSATNGQGDAALMCAVRKGHVDAVEFLLGEPDADVSQTGACVCVCVCGGGGLYTGCG